MSELIQQSTAVSESTVASRPRVVSFLISEEWALLLDSWGLDVDYVVYWEHPTWDWQKHEMPSTARFVSDIVISRYAAAVVPIGEVPKSPSDSEMLEKFLNLQKVSGLKAICVGKIGADKGKDEPEDWVLSRQESLGLDREVFTPLAPILNVVQQAPKAHGSPNRIKRRWPLATHPGWLRHCHFVTQMLLGEKDEEPTGTLVELDAGDGCMTRWIQKRFGKLDVYGKCRRQEEYDAAKRVEKEIPIAVVSDYSGMGKFDYFVAADCRPEDLDEILTAVNEGCTKKAVVTMSKNMAEDLNPFTLLEKFDGWRLLEMPSHYALVKSCV